MNSLNPLSGHKNRISFRNFIQIYDTKFYSENSIVFVFYLQLHKVNTVVWKNSFLVGVHFWFQSRMEKLT